MHGQSMVNKINKKPTKVVPLVEPEDPPPNQFPLHWGQASLQGRSTRGAPKQVDSSEFCLWFPEKQTHPQGCSFRPDPEKGSTEKPSLTLEAGSLTRHPPVVAVADLHELSKSQSSIYVPCKYHPNKMITHMGLSRKLLLKTSQMRKNVGVM